MCVYNAGFLVRGFSSFEPEDLRQAASPKTKLHRILTRCWMRSLGEGGSWSILPYGGSLFFETVRKSTIEVENNREEGGLSEATSLGSSGSAAK